MQPLLIFDKSNHTFTGPKVILKDYFSLNPTSVLGGEETLDFKIPVTSFLFEAEDYVLFERKRYVVKRHRVRKDDSGLYVEVSCEGLYTMLIDYRIDGEDTWLQGASARTALERILRGTPFKVGKCDDFGTWDIELKELNCLEAINKVRESWPSTMEVYFDGFTLNAVVVRGTDTAYQIHYHTNLVDIERVVDSSGVVTRLVGLGASGLTIEGLDESKVNEKDGVHISGGKVSAKYIDAPNIGDYSHPKMHYEDFSEIKEQKDLLEAMQKWLVGRYTPKMTYTVTFSEMLRQGVAYSDIQIGDFVYINDKDFGQVKLRVVELSRDAFNIEHSTATLGERYKTLEDYLSDFDASKDIWDKIENGEIDSKLEAALEEALKWLNSGQNTCFITENDGIICADRRTLGPDNTIINTTRLIKMSSGAIGCSVNGGQSYTSAMTPEGVVAESIIGGRIHSSHITVGDESAFEDGYSPTDIRKPIAVDLEHYKDSIVGHLKDMEKEFTILNSSVAQTNTAMDLLKEDLKDKIDILHQDVSGLSGDVESMEKMYDNVNDMLFGNSYFRWTKEGIHATDMLEPRYQMLLGAKGIGFSNNGGEFFENAITARGIVASQVNIGVFGQEPFKGLTIRNGIGQETFAIDTNGNVSLMGNINMQGGSIAWHQVSRIPYEALDEELRGKYTYIDSNGVYTGLVATRQLQLDGPFKVQKNGETTFLINSDGSVYMNGSIHLKQGSVIDWSNVNTPDLGDLGAVSSDDFNAFVNNVNPRLTKITATGIYTGTIDAGNIVVSGPGSVIPKEAIDIQLVDLGGASLSELNFWVDNVKGELGNLDDKIPTENQITTITNNAIKTAKISANQIFGGEIAGVQIYCDDKIIIGKKVNSVEPRIIFAPDDEYTAITYKTNESGESYLGMQSDNGMSLFTKNTMKITAQQVLDIRAPQILINGKPFDGSSGSGGSGGSGGGDNTGGGNTGGSIGGGDLEVDVQAYAKNYVLKTKENYTIKAGIDATINANGTAMYQSGKSTNIVAGGVLNLSSGGANDASLGKDININPDNGGIINIMGDIRMNGSKFLDELEFGDISCGTIYPDAIRGGKLNERFMIRHHTDDGIGIEALEGRIDIATNQGSMQIQAGKTLDIFSTGGITKIKGASLILEADTQNGSPQIRWTDYTNAPDYVTYTYQMKDVIAKIDEIAKQLGLEPIPCETKKF